MVDDTDIQEAQMFAELQRVRLQRVYSDPVITHSKNVDWGFAEDANLTKHIIMARMKRLRTAPEGAPIKLATLPEAVAYLVSASMDAGAATGTVPALYHIAMREYIKEYDVEAPEWLNDELEGEEFHQKRLVDLRREIRREQDRNFLSERFSDLGLQQLSKSFWDGKASATTPHRGTAGGV